MRTKIKAFFDAQSGKLNRTVIPEFHEHDDVLVHHLPEDGEKMVEISMATYRALCPRGDYQPEPQALEAYFANVRA